MKIFCVSCDKEVQAVAIFGNHIYPHREDLYSRKFYQFIVAFNSKHYTTMMVVGKYTHQLQHALRLAGVGKEIEL